MEIKDILHYGSGVLLLLLGAIGETGWFADYLTVASPHADLVMGAGILGLGAKVDANATKIAVGLVVLLALFIPFQMSYAADLMLTKAPVHAAVSDCTVKDCSGAFVGANVAGIGTSLDVLGSGLNQSVFGGGGMIGAQAEYQLWNGKYFAAAGAMGDFSVNTSGAPVSQNKFLGLAYVKLGIGISGVLGAPTGTGTVAGISADLQGAMISPYGIVGAVPFGHQGWASGAGVAFALAPLWELSLDYIHISYKSGEIDNVVAAPLAITAQSNSDNIVRIGIARKISN